MFGFQKETQLLHECVNQIFKVAEVWEYIAGGQRLVERVLMNFHPDILAQEPFWDKPPSLKGLCQVVGFVEDKIADVPERQKMEGIWRSSGGVTYESQNVSPHKKTVAEMLEV